MTKLTCDITMSLDGFVAGPNQTLEEPLGAGGERLHEWMMKLKSFRSRHGMEGGETGPDDDLMEESFSAPGAMIMGRRMFSGGAGPWESDPNADAWWGDDPPFGVPVLILTHHPRATVEKENGTKFVFVTDGIESALEQARAAAGERSVAIAGGASVVQEYLKAGLLDELQIHLVPILLGGGVRLLDGLDPARLEVGASGLVAVRHPSPIPHRSALLGGFAMVHPMLADQNREVGG